MASSIPQDPLARSSAAEAADDAVVERDTASIRSSPKPSASTATRAGTVWVAVVVALILLVLLIIFILTNQVPVNIMFLGLESSLPLGVALLMAAVAGGLLVAAAGVARILQLRLKARRVRKLHAAS
ncbi:lipopolysaccharide assembly protein LapA domain-containing protein [Arthrobacter sp. RAF14]|uniref:lipopolysaccharide assembly protein LapA domain-containing protein n=1 Tax=Arthrobacter sp. RAF14 TaxID=3233051 RepID=UPI003F8F9942